LNKVFVVIPAAGMGDRFQSDKPKQFLYYNGEIIIRSVVKTFLDVKDVYAILCVIPEGFLERYNFIFRNFQDKRILPPVIGGETRKDSVRNGLQAISKLSPDYVLIHDAARANIDKNTINSVIEALKSGEKAVIPGISPVDSVRISGKHFDRKKVTLVQTPQGFDFKTIFALHNKYSALNVTDDAGLCDIEGINVKITQGNVNNKKITYKSDIKQPEIRIGFGFDTHAFSKDKTRELFLMGAYIEGHIGLEGVSDADVGIHSLVDAILGALGKGSIGELFPPTDMKFKNYDSKKFLKYCSALLLKYEYSVINCDTTIVCETPNISKYSELMKKIVAEILMIDDTLINIKGKTTEGLGFTGRKEGISAYSSVLIRNSRNID
jgi:2-C-methyl-D-erythritol 4-phosphate cytidylyltransferase/2-C-methyl-D-erythritol 2,4-cyclodiphosphate synthase